jgi:beta-lactamase regulating signal transducer with metallopeptidase domain
MIEKNLANELVAVGGWIAVLGAFLAAIGSTGQVEPDEDTSSANQTNDKESNDLKKQVLQQKKQLQKQQIQIELIQLEQELNTIINSTRKNG